MNEANYWKQFFCTGKVEDYLKYKQCKSTETEQNEENDRVKEEPYAGFYHSNGNRDKDGTYFGIR